MGILYLVSTPIGNLEDISLRAARVLVEADLILCEDTRRTGRLLEWLKSEEAFSGLGLEESELLSYTDYTRDKRMDEVLARLAKGEEIALVTDSGTPLLSDPGYKLVQKVVELSNDFDVDVKSIPGANAVLPALQLSGMPPDKFIFLGFSPRSSKKRRELFKELQASSLPIKTAIYFESPHRLLDSLADLEEVFGDVRVAVCRELTKMHEEIFRGVVSDAVEHFEQNGVKGEITVVFSLQ